MQAKQEAWLCGVEKSPLRKDWYTGGFLQDVGQTGGLALQGWLRKISQEEDWYQRISSRRGVGQMGGLALRGWLRKAIPERRGWYWRIFSMRRPTRRPGLATWEGRTWHWSGEGLAYDQNTTGFSGSGYGRQPNTPYLSHIKGGGGLTGRVCTLYIFLTVD